jgi:DNA primase
MARLEPSGRGRWRTLCLAPDHHDEHPSMVVYGDDNHVHCFTCGFHGDVIDLTKLYFNTDSFRDAVQRLADATSSMAGKVVA